VKPTLGDDIESGRLVLGGLGAASTGPRANAMQGGGALLHLTRLKRIAPAPPTGPRTSPSPGGGGYGGGRIYEQER
jgi:hypothetical protein